MKPMLHRLAPVLGVVMFVGAAWLLYHQLQHYHMRDIRQAFHDIPMWRLWAAAGLTVINYLVLISYDYLAIRAIRHPLPLSKIALASFTGFATSYNFGSLLGGTSVRYRLYSAWGLSAVEILQLVVMLGITFWLGILALAGVFFVVQPFPMPPRLHLPFDTVRPLGLVLLAVAGGYVGLTGARTAPVRLRELRVQLPGTGTTLLQLGVAAADLMLAAACLYILVSHEVTVGYGTFLGMYLLAVVAGVMTHVPGGVGVFELVVLTLTGPQSSATVVAALLAFRVIYYLLPLSVAVCLLTANEIALRRVIPKRVWQDIGRWAGLLAPTLLAWGTFIAGVILLFSGATPMLHGRLEPLRHIIPLPLLEASHFVGSLVGAGLLLVARGLQRRLDAAWWLSMALLLIGIVASLLKGLDYEEAILLTLVAAGLMGCRRRFYRRGALIHQRFTPGWVGTIVLALLCSVWLGMFAYKHVEYTSDLWWRFAFRGDASRFLRASIGASVVLLLFAVRKLVSAHVPRPATPTPDDLATAAHIVQASSRTVANLALLGDKTILFNDARNAFVMYAVQGRSWVAMGDPVGPYTARSDLVWRFRERVDHYAGWPVFYQVAEDNLPIYLDQGLSLLKIGEEARVPLSEFGLEGSARKSLRQVQHRCHRAHCQFELIPVQQVPPLLPQLKEISDAWLAHKNASEKGFSLGCFDPTYVQRFPCALVRQDGRPIAFANVWCGAQQVELSIDLMRYAPDAPAGVMEYLFIALMQWGKAQGYQWFNLGMAPLAGIENRPLAPLWNRAVNLVFRHGDHFYSFQGLRQYKQKFTPVWQPKYLASPGGLALPRILADVTTLISKRREANHHLT
jgi:phosphatidylglycerol lysyltransferase